MAEYDQLLQAVLDNPDDDAPRLAYADWCDKQSDKPTLARAEFIRLQIEIARMGSPQLNSGEAYHLQSREINLTDEYRLNWAGVIAGLVDDLAFYRGFVELVTMSARAFLEHAAELMSLAPIRHLNLTGVPEIADQLFTSGYLYSMRSLGLDHCGLGDLHLKMVAASPEAARLRWLSVAENHIGMDGAEALATSPHLKRLKYVNFSGNPVDPAEEGGQDGGIIVATWLPEAGQTLESRHGHLAWLHRAGETIFDFHPSRFRL